ncbi:hypothetical protein OG775_31195 [Streptomyces platensis]|uniref:hypothetical protein n=1 Tax=Streptomyces platensis TaxID=58346 RepID=UPI00225BBAA1|nr:hypothetical protein [Streptomyces platensis]MCX4639529.1 hypothetical protein [Streptomyces platensis]
MSAETTMEAGERAEAGHDSPGLRAYLPNRQMVRALCSGSAVLVGRGWAWITAEGPKETRARLGYTALGAYAGVYVADSMPQIVMPAVVVGWIGAALMLAPSPPPPGGAARPAVNLTKGADEEHQEDEHDQAVEEDEDFVEPDMETVAGLIRRLAGTQQGAHLDDLLATGELGDWDKDELKTALAEWEIPVEEKGFTLRFSGRQRVRQGVRLRDLPAGAGEAPAGAGEGPTPAPAQHPAETPGSAPSSTPSAGPAPAAADPSPHPASDPSQGAPVDG